MKTLLRASAILILTVAAGCVGKENGPARTGAGVVKTASQPLPLQKQFFLPEKLYAVPGKATSKRYFREICRCVYLL